MAVAEQAEQEVTAPPVPRGKRSFRPRYPSWLTAPSLAYYVIFFLGPLLSSLPVCILAVIIIYSMKSAFQKMPREFVHLWRVSKIDFVSFLKYIFKILIKFKFLF